MKVRTVINFWQSFKGLFGRRVSLKDPVKWVVDWWGGPESATGVNVTTTTAMQLSSVFGCVKILRETIGSMPLIMYERIKTGKQRAFEHPLFNILRYSPNPEMSARQWLATVMGHLGLRGDSYNEIVFDQGGRVKELWPLTPQRVTLTRIKRSDGISGALQYEIDLPGGGIAYLAPENMLHIRAFSDDGLTGMSPIEAGIEVVGLGIAAQTHAAKYFANDATPGGFLEHPGNLSQPAQDRMRKAHEQEHMGVGKKFRLKILEENMKWKQGGISAKDSQLLESRKFQVEEIARLYRMPLHKLQNLDQASFSNIEHQSIEFLSDTIYPWLVLIEQEILLKLLTPIERKIYFPEFLIAGILRADIKTRYEAYAIGRQWGWLSADDIRRMENMNDLPDKQGAMYLVPMNMIPASMIGTEGQNSLLRAICADPKAAKKVLTNSSPDNEAS